MTVFYAHPDGYLREAGTGTVGAPWDGSPAFTLGTTEPVGGVNVGSGVLRAAPTQTIAVGGDVSLSGSTYTITGPVVDRIIPGFVNLTDGASLENCMVTGPSTEVVAVRALIQGPSNTGQATVSFCTVDPQVASAYYDAFGPQGLHVTRSWAVNTTDGIRAFNNTGGTTCRLKFEGVHITGHSQFAPDYANGNREETHNDCIQAQGNSGGTNTDILIDGCSLNARHSTTKGDIPPYRDEISAVMVTPNVSAVHMTVTRSWLRGGIVTVNMLNTGASMASSTVVLTDNRMERPGTDTLAPNVAIGVASGNGITLTATGNTYIDNGAAVPVTTI